MQIQRLPGDTLLVLSRRPGLTWLSPQCDYLRSERVNLNEVVRLPCRIAEGNWHVLGDGSLLTMLADNFSFDPCPPSPDSPWRETGLIVRSSALDGTFDTLGIFPATERNSPNYRAFGRSLVLAFGPGRVYAGDKRPRAFPDCLPGTPSEGRLAGNDHPGQAAQFETAIPDHRGGTSGSRREGGRVNREPEAGILARIPLLPLALALLTVAKRGWVISPF